ELTISLIDAVDVPRGSTSLDPYRDLELRGPQLTAVRDNMSRAVEARRALIRSEILEQLQRTQVEVWMANLITARERSDRMLAVLDELLTLLELAIREHAAV